MSTSRHPCGWAGVGNVRTIERLVAGLRSSAVRESASCTKPSSSSPNDTKKRETERRWKALFGRLENLRIMVCSPYSAVVVPSFDTPIMAQPSGSPIETPLPPDNRPCSPQLSIFVLILSLLLFDRILKQGFAVQLVHDASCWHI